LNQFYFKLLNYGESVPIETLKSREYFIHFFKLIFVSDPILISQLHWKSQTLCLNLSGCLT